MATKKAGKPSARTIKAYKAKSRQLEQLLKKRDELDLRIMEVKIEMMTSRVPGTAVKGATCLLKD